MALLQTINLEHLPTDHTIHIALYRNIKNASFLHQQLLAGNTDFEYALIDASIVSLSLIRFASSSSDPSDFYTSCENHVLNTPSQIVSKLHALAAVYRAVTDSIENRLRSRNIHSEIVFSLSPNNNVCSLHSTYLRHH